MKLILTKKELYTVGSVVETNVIIVKMKNTDQFDMYRETDKRFERLRVIIAEIKNATL